MVNKKTTKEWVVSAIIMIVILGIKIFISFHMKSAFIFSDEQSYFGMADKIAKFNFGGITNSHMPGYSLLIAFFYAIAPTSNIAYHVVLIINSIVGTLSYLLTFILTKYVFKITGKYSILIACLSSLASGWYAYNYVVLSETLQTFLYLAAFTIFCYMYCKKETAKIWLWVILGIIVGYLPIVKTQAMIFMVLFWIFALAYQITKGKIINKRGLIVALGISVIVYLIVRYGIFRNVGMYEGQASDNLSSILTIFLSWDNFIVFVHICFSEIAYFFVATGMIPTFFVVMFLIDSVKDVVKDKEKIFITLFVLSIWFANMGVTIIHAYWVYIDKGMVTVYARYLDFFQPILITAGLALMIKYTKTIKKKFFALFSIIMFFLIIVVYPSIGKIDVNTYSVKLFNNMSTMLYTFVFLILFILLLTLLRRKQNVWLVLVCLTGIYLAMDYSAVKIQLLNGDNMANTYNVSYYLAQNTISGDSIVMDSDLVGVPLKEDYYSGANDSEANKEVSADKEVDLKYSVLFWGVKDNYISQKPVSKDYDAYIYTNKLLTRDVLDTSGGLILYDKTSKADFTVGADTIYRTSNENLEFANSDFLRVTGNKVSTNLYVDNIQEIEIGFNYAENVIISPEENDIRCYINGTEIQRVSENEPTNRIKFRYSGTTPVTVETLCVDYDGKYSELISNGTLYIQSVDVSWR